MVPSQFGNQLIVNSLTLDVPPCIWSQKIFDFTSSWRMTGTQSVSQLLLFQANFHPQMDFGTGSISQPLLRQRFTQDTMSSSMKYHKIEKYPPRQGWFQSLLGWQIFLAGLNASVWPIKCGPPFVNLIVEAVPWSNLSRRLCCDVIPCMWGWYTFLHAKWDFQWHSVIIIYWPEEIFTHHKKPWHIFQASDIPLALTLTPEWTFACKCWLILPVPKYIMRWEFTQKI